MCFGSSYRGDWLWQTLLAENGPEGLFSEDDTYLCDMSLVKPVQCHKAKVIASCMVACLRRSGWYVNTSCPLVQLYTWPTRRTGPSVPCKCTRWWLWVRAILAPNWSQTSIWCSSDALRTEICSKILLQWWSQNTHWNEETFCIADRLKSWRKCSDWNGRGEDSFQKHYSTALCTGTIPWAGQVSTLRKAQQL